MARNFVRASSHNLRATSVSPFPITTYPFTLACWFNKDNNTETSTTFGVADNSVSTELAFLQLSANDKPRAVLFTSPSSGTAEHTTSYAVGSWQHVAGTFTNSTLREVFLDGIGGDTDTTNLAFPTGLDEINISGSGGAGPGNYMGGDLAECGMWDVTLTDAEIASLAKGTPPSQIRPGSLVGYWPMWSDLIGIDLSGNGNNLTNTGTTPADHSPMARYVNHSSPQAQRRVRSTDDALIFDKVIPL